MHKWGCLRKHIPCNVKLPKVCALVKTLCILHNFCINEQIERKLGTTDCYSVLQKDINSIVISGGSGRKSLDIMDSNFNPDIHRDNQFLDVGHHSDGISRTLVRNTRAEPQLVSGLPLPRKKC